MSLRFWGYRISPLEVIARLRLSELRSRKPWLATDRKPVLFVEAGLTGPSASESRDQLTCRQRLTAQKKDSLRRRRASQSLPGPGPLLPCQPEPSTPRASQDLLSQNPLAPDRSKSFKQKKSRGFEPDPAQTLHPPVLHRCKNER